MSIPPEFSQISKIPPLYEAPGDIKELLASPEPFKNYLLNAIEYIRFQNLLNSSYEVCSKSKKNSLPTINIDLYDLILYFNNELKNSIKNHPWLVGHSAGNIFTNSKSSVIKICYYLKDMNRIMLSKILGAYIFKRLEQYYPHLILNNSKEVHSTICDEYFIAGTAPFVLDLGAIEFQFVTDEQRSLESNIDSFQIAITEGNPYAICTSSKGVVQNVREHLNTLIELDQRICKIYNPDTVPNLYLYLQQHQSQGFYIDPNDHLIGMKQLHQEFLKDRHALPPAFKTQQSKHFKSAEGQVINFLNFVQNQITFQASVAEQSIKESPYLDCCRSIAYLTNTDPSLKMAKNLSLLILRYPQKAEKLMSVAQGLALLEWACANNSNIIAYPAILNNFRYQILWQKQDETYALTLTQNPLNLIMSFLNSWNELLEEIPLQDLKSFIEMGTELGFTNKLELTNANRIKVVERWVDLLSTPPLSNVLFYQFKNSLNLNTFYQSIQKELINPQSAFKIEKAILLNELAKSRHLASLARQEVSLKLIDHLTALIHSTKNTQEMILRSLLDFIVKANSNDPIFKDAALTSILLKQCKHKLKSNELSFETIESFYPFILRFLEIDLKFAEELFHDEAVQKSLSATKQLELNWVLMDRYIRLKDSTITLQIYSLWKLAASSQNSTIDTSKVATSIHVFNAVLESDKKLALEAIPNIITFLLSHLKNEQSLKFLKSEHITILTSAISFLEQTIEHDLSKSSLSPIVDAIFNLSQILFTQRPLLKEHYLKIKKHFSMLSLPNQAEFLLNSLRHNFNDLFLQTWRDENPKVILPDATLYELCKLISASNDKNLFPILREIFIKPLNKHFEIYSLYLKHIAIDRGSSHEFYEQIKSDFAYLPTLNPELARLKANTKIKKCFESFRKCLAAHPKKNFKCSKVALNHNVLAPHKNLRDLADLYLQLFKYVHSIIKDTDAPYDAHHLLDAMWLSALQGFRGKQFETQLNQMRNSSIEILLQKKDIDYLFKAVAFYESRRDKNIATSLKILTSLSIASLDLTKENMSIDVIDQFVKSLVSDRGLFYQILTKESYQKSFFKILQNFNSNPSQHIQYQGLCLLQTLLSGSSEDPKPTLQVSSSQFPEIYDFITKLLEHHVFTQNLTSIFDLSLIAQKHLVNRHLSEYFKMLNGVLSSYYNGLLKSLKGGDLTPIPEIYKTLEQLISIYCQFERPLIDASGKYHKPTLPQTIMTIFSSILPSLEEQRKENLSILKLAAELAKKVDKFDLFDSKKPNTKKNSPIALQRFEHIGHKVRLICVISREPAHSFIDAADFFLSLSSGNKHLESNDADKIHLLTIACYEKIHLRFVQDIINSKNLIPYEKFKKLTTHLIKESITKTQAANAMDPICDAVILLLLMPSTAGFILNYLITKNADKNNLHKYKNEIIKEFMLTNFDALSVLKKGQLLENILEIFKYIDWHSQKECLINEETGVLFYKLAYELYHTVKQNITANVKASLIKTIDFLIKYKYLTAKKAEEQLTKFLTNLTSNSNTSPTEPKKDHKAGQEKERQNRK